MNKKRAKRATNYQYFILFMYHNASAPAGAGKNVAASAGLRSVAYQCVQPTSISNLQGVYFLCKFSLSAIERKGQAKLCQRPCGKESKHLGAIVAVKPLLYMQSSTLKFGHKTNLCIVMINKYRTFEDGEYSKSNIK